MSDSASHLIHTLATVEPSWCVGLIVWTLQKIAAPIQSATVPIQSATASNLTKIQEREFEMTETTKLSTYSQACLAAIQGKAVVYTKDGFKIRSGK